MQCWNRLDRTRGGDIEVLRSDMVIAMRGADFQGSG